MWDNNNKGTLTVLNFCFTHKYFIYTFTDTLILINFLKTNFIEKLKKCLYSFLKSQENVDLTTFIHNGRMILTTCTKYYEIYSQVSLEFVLKQSKINWNISLITTYYREIKKIKWNNTWQVIYSPVNEKEVLVKGILLNF